MRMAGGALPDYIGESAVVVRRPLEQDYLAPPTFFFKEDADKDIEEAQGVAYT